MIATKSEAKPTAEVIPPTCSSPSPCLWCAGHGWEPQEVGSPLPCPECHGSAVCPASGDAGTTRTYRSRPFTFNPGSGALVLTRKGKPSRYKVKRVNGGYELRKIGEPIVHHAFLGTYSTCDCAAGTYGTSHRADERARAEGGEQYPTLGCVHLDVLSLLKASNYLDIPAVPAPTLA